MKNVTNYIVSGQDETGWRQVCKFTYAENAVREYDRMEAMGFRNIHFENVSDTVQLVDGQYL